MPRFRYTAVDAKNQPLTGEVEGTELAAVRAALSRHGLQVVTLQAVTEPRGSLSLSESAAISQQIALATGRELPLVGSLRAFTEEVYSSRLKRRLARVCEALETGEPLEKVLTNPALRLPASVSAILSSGLPHEAMTHLLSRALRAATTTADLRARAFLLLTYPILMIGVLGVFWLFLLLVVTPHIEEIFKDFGLQVSPLATQLFLMSHVLQSWNVLYLLTLIPVFVLGTAAFRVGLSAAARRRWWCGIPILGAMYRLTALSEFAHLLALMLESRVPLPQALMWSSAGINDADLQACCEDLAARLRWGEDPVSAARSAAGIPAHLEQMLHWAAHGVAGAEPLRTMARLLEIRAKSLSSAAMPLLEPLMLIAMVVSVLAYILTIFPPLIKLLNDLS